MEIRGYRGKVTLRSPSGESVTIRVPGRRKSNYGGGSVELDSWYAHLEQDGRRDRMLRRLLSAGWKVVSQDGQPVRQEDGEVGEEEKKDTNLVIGTTKSGNASHGGEHASAEVEDSPNAAEQGKRARKCRGGQKHRRSPERQRSKASVRVQVQNAGQYGSVGVYSPQPLCVNPDLMKSAERSAELLAELVGRSHIKVRRGVTVNAEDLLLALEIGDNPLPPLEDPDERPKLKILVTPDCSGSTQDWNGLGQAWALHLSRIPDVDVMYFTNSNGTIWEVEGDAAVRTLMESADVVLYLGDEDGREMCERYASYGATVLALDSYSANSANPRLKDKRGGNGQGTLYWVDRVSAKAPFTWARAVELCLKA